MKTPNIRAVLLACTALACGPQTQETAGETATTGATTDPGTTAPPTGDGGEPPSACAVEPVATECDNNLVGYFFDAASQTCRPFDHGTCGGEVVPFESEAACQAACEPCDKLLGQPSPAPDEGVTFTLRNDSAAPIYLRSYTPEPTPIGFRSQIFTLFDPVPDEELILAVNECSFSCAAFANDQCAAGCSDAGSPPPPIVIHPGGVFTDTWNGLHFGTVAPPDRCLPAACEPGLECGRWFATPPAEYVVKAVVATQWDCEGPDCLCDGNPDGWCKLPEVGGFGDPIDPQELEGWLFYPGDGAQLVFE